MAVKIRLARGGTKKKPVYRVVVADIESPRDGKFIEVVGTYNPNVEPAAVEFNKDKVAKWIGEGAIATTTVKSLLKKAGIVTTVTKAA